MLTPEQEAVLSDEERSGQLSAYQLKFLLADARLWIRDLEARLARIKAASDVDNDKWDDIVVPPQGGG